MHENYKSKQETEETEALECSVSFFTISGKVYLKDLRWKVKYSAFTVESSLLTLLHFPFH